MGRINLLQPNVFNMLAAGEVVERPSSVVKELVENAIDAGATNVDIYIENGGKRKIVVSDNGIGIAKDDLRSAFLPHATSKISNITDLDSISTLGFRGEALASIASISHIELTSRYKDVESANTIVLDGGNVASEFESARSIGTTIIVENLFYNTPARLKFLKKDVLEQNYIKDIVKLLIIANPSININLSSENGILVKNNSGSLLDSIYSIYGACDADELLEIKPIQNSKIRVSGYTSKVDFVKSNKTYQTIIVNGRVIQDLNIQAVVQNAYSKYLMTRTYPMYILDIVIPFDELDVNVSPSKTEVRFLDKQSVNGVIYHSILNTIENPISNNSFELKINSTIENQDNQMQDNINGLKASVVENESDKDLFDIFYKAMPNEAIISTGKHDVDSSGNSLNSLEFIKQDYYDWKIVGQVFRTYIIIEKKDSIYIIDQHAAHERLLFDKIYENLTPKYVQNLIVPFRIKLTANDMDLFEEIKNQLELFGFAFNYENNEYYLISVPEAIIGMKFDMLFADIIDKSIDFSSINFADLLKEKICQTACKAAIKGGEFLTKEQISKVLDTLCSNNGLLPTKCPHGRPCVVELTKNDFEKMFKRIV